MELVLKNIYGPLSKNLYIGIITPVLVFMLLLIFTRLNFSDTKQIERTKILSPVSRYVNKYYVDKHRVDARQMLEKGLLKLERIIDELLIEFPKDNNKNYFVIHISGKIKSFDFSYLNKMGDLTEIYDEVFQFISLNYTPTDSSMLDIEYAVVDEMLKTLDSNSGIITPRVYKEFMIETEGSFGGLGIVIGIREGELTVISPIEGTPAYKVGIKPKDKIVQIEDGSTVNMSLLEAVSKLRGKKGTKVTIYILREGLTQPKKYIIKRDTINIESVDAFALENNVIYLRIRDFQKNTLSSIEEQLNDLTGNNMNSLNGIILDLRGNPGGLLDQAQKISDLFLQQGTIVTTKIGSSEKSYKANSRGINYRGKLVVLVNAGSASASEIVAAALKNNDRAIIIGQTTFGKGSVQQIFNLKQGAALKLTIANYLTPGDISIQDIGITPDISLKPAKISADKIILNSYRDKSKKSSGQTQTEDPVYTLRYLENEVQTEDELPEEAFNKEQIKKNLENDYAVILSKNIIESISNTIRVLNLNNLKDKIKNYSVIEDQKIAEKLNTLGIDWSLENLSNENNNLLVRVIKNKTVVNAGEKLDITVEAINSGEQPIYRLKAKTESENPALSGKEFIFGRILSSEKNSWTNQFEIPKWFSSRNDEVILKFYDHKNDLIKETKFDIVIKGLQRPIFAYSFELIDDGRYETRGNGNGIPEQNELLGLKVNIKNIGKGNSEKTTILLKHKKDSNIFLKKGRLNIENLNPGDEQHITFLFSLNEPVKNFDLDLQIIDDVFRNGLSDKLKFGSGNEGKKPLSILEQVFAVSKDDVPVYGGTFINSPLIAYLNKDSQIKSIAKNGQWVKIRLDELNNGWVDKKYLLDTSQTNNSYIPINLQKVYNEPPSIEITELPLVSESSKIDIEGKISDSNGVKLVAIFVGEDKVYLNTTNKLESTLSATLNLDKGINYINIIAKDSTGLESKKTFIVRSDA